MIEWTILPDAAALAQHAAEHILADARQAIAARGVFHLVLAGGRTPEAVYRRLGQADFAGARWHLWWGDERCLAPIDTQRNSQMVYRAWLHAGQIPEDNWHPIPAELGPEAGAQRYAELLPATPFDLTLLGLGEDGHTASLFPGHEIGCPPTAPPVLAVREAPKPPAERISLSCARLSYSRQVLFLVSGADKRPALTAWRAGKSLPAARIGALHTVHGLADRAAWPAD